MEKIGHILLATDGSEGALRAAKLAGVFARSCGANVSVAVVHSEDALLLPAIAGAVLPGSVPFTPFPKKDAMKRIEGTADDTILPDTERALGAITGALERVQLWGHTAEQLCGYADATQVDMIVIGRRGRSAFKKLVLGGVSSQVVNHAQCPVTVVP